MSKTLIFKKNEESRSKTSTVGRKESIFSESYTKAYDVLNTICGHTWQYYTNRDQKGPWGISSDLYNYYNNLIVFSARRGCGKTSAMLTFSRSLRDKPQKNNGTDDELLQKYYECTNDRNFIVLSPIDPSTLDEQHDILTVILSRIFYEASSIWEGLEHQNEKLAYKEQVIQYLRECYSGIASLSSDAGKNREWTLEELSQLGDSSILRKNIYKLMKSVIDLKGYDPERTQIVIQIDDADMNFNCMFDIMEKIRNYMIIPNVTILFAADIDLMWRLIYKKYLSTLRSNDRNGLKDDEKNAVELTEQYMLKCFPLKHRIYLKNLNDVIQQNQDSVYLLIDGDDDEKVLRKLYASGWNDDIMRILGTQTNSLSVTVSQYSFRHKDSKSEELSRYHLEYSLLRCLFRRTGLYFSQFQGFHHILPQTQRGFVHFISILEDMKDIRHLDEADNYQRDTKLENKRVPYLYYLDSEDRIEQIEDWLHNVNLFYDYFMSAWLQANLSAEEQNIIRGLAAEHVADKNSYIILKVCDLLNISEKDQSKEHYFLMLRGLLDRHQKTKGGLFSFAVRTYYAILTQIIILSEIKHHYEGIEKGTIDERTLCVFHNLRYLYRYGYLSTSQLKSEGQKKYLKLTYETEYRLPLSWRASEASWGDQLYGVDYEAQALRWLMTGNSGDQCDFRAPMLNCLFWNDPEQYLHCSAEYVSKLRELQDASLCILTSVDSQQSIGDMFRTGVRIEQIEHSLTESGRFGLLKAFYDQLVKVNWFSNEIQDADASRTVGWLVIGAKQQADLAKAVREASSKTAANDAMVALEELKKHIDKIYEDIFGNEW